MNNPLVSICIPTYNGESFLKEALESVQLQTYSNLEIVCSDDHSTDGTLDILNEFKSSTSIPITLINHEPAGIGANWNNCINKAKGDYIKLFFQDDLLKPHCISHMMEAANKYPEVGLINCKREIIMEENDHLGKQWYEKYKALHAHWAIDLPIKEPIDGKKLLSDKNLMSGPMNKIGEPTATLIKTEVFENLGYFDENLKQFLDIEYWYRIMSDYPVLFIDEELITFRLHAAQASQKNMEGPGESEQLYELLFKKYGKYFDKELYQKLRKKYGLEYKMYRKLKHVIGKRK